MKSNNVAKKAIALVCALTAGASAFAGCGKKIADTDQTLEVTCWSGGYGTKWVQPMIDAFKEQAWVKEKYPNLEVVYNDQAGSMINTLLDAGERANTIDLFFAASGVRRYQGTNALGKSIMCDLTDVVYHQPVPGEDVTVYEKMDPAYLDMHQFYEKGQDSNSDVPFKSYAYPWVKGMDSIIYNAGYLEAIGVEMPVTTNEFLEACEKIVTEKPFDYNNEPNGAYAILTDDVGRYWYNLYPTWWAQYEGMEEYYNFFNGVAGGRISADIHRQRGKLHSLTAMEKILDWDNGYVYQKRTGLDYMQAQTNFVKGHGVFYANGDYFASEMEQVIKDVEELEGIKEDLRMMPLPIISEIIEKTPTIPDEETLRVVIRAIDMGFADPTQARLEGTGSLENVDKLTNVSGADYNKILEARGYVHAAAAGACSFVPSYATAKEVAFDFLRFMSTDIAQEVYIEYTGGASLPIRYDVKRKNPELYEQLLPIQKCRLAMEYDAVYTTTALPRPDAFPLVLYGEMSAVHSISTSIVNFFAAPGATGTAKEIYEADIAYYIDAGNFNSCRDKAELS